MWWPQAGINAAAASHSPKQKAGTIEYDQAVKAIEKMALHVNANIPHKGQLATFVPWQSIQLTAHLAGVTPGSILSCANLFKDAFETAELSRSLCEQSSGWSVKSLAKQVGYEFSGTTGMAIVLKQSARIDQPASGLRIVFELKRKTMREDHYQALILFLLSNGLSGCLTPIVIVTDFNEHYCLYWLDDHTVFFHTVDGPCMALGIIKGCLHQEQVTAMSELQPGQVGPYPP